MHVLTNEQRYMGLYHAGGTGTSSHALLRIITVDDYCYTEHLLALENCKPVDCPLVSVPAAAREVRSPLRVIAWRRTSGTIQTSDTKNT